MTTPRMTRSQRAVLSVLPTRREEAIDTHAISVLLSKRMGNLDPYNYDAAYSILSRLEMHGIVGKVGRPAAWWRKESA